MSIIGPRPALQLYFSFRIFSLPAYMIKVKGDTSFIHSASHLPQSRQESYTFSNNEKSPSFTITTPSTIGKSFGQFLWQLPQPLQFIAISIQPCSSGTALLDFLIGFTLIAVSTATFPAFTGSRISTPSILPLTKSSIISSAGSLVRSGNPPIFFSFVAINGAFTSFACSWLRRLTHCSSTITTSANPERM
ncbi:hypothetical protein ES703_78467 [subsurface metagenome]